MLPADAGIRYAKIGRIILCRVMQGVIFSVRRWRYDIRVLRVPSKNLVSIIAALVIVHVILQIHFC